MGKRGGTDLPKQDQRTYLSSYKKQAGEIKRKNVIKIRWRHPKGKTVRRKT